MTLHHEDENLMGFHVGLHIFVGGIHILIVFRAIKTFVA